ncbi:serine hydrolase [Streptomyces sp. cmx-18-6]|uniref:serine hydrolase n=1 Tax=Streptomyces sp. cmx-18-6 TaxID=2790930 RepID=UPI00397F2568
MAGESPDKTEQRKSSGTAAEERDPRFAVFRDPDAGADVDADAGAATAADADAATAVFRPRLSEESTTAAEGTEGTEGAGVSAGADGAEGAVTPQGPVEGSEDPKGPDAAVKASEGDSEGEGTAGSGTRDEVDAGADAEAGENADADAGAEPEPGDVRLRAAVAAWVDASAEDDDDTADKPAGDVDAEPESEREPERDAGRKAEAAEEAEGEPEAKPAEQPDAETRTETAETRTETEAAGDAEAEADAGDAAEADAEAGDTPESGSDLRGIDQPTAVFRAIGPAGKIDQPTTALKLSPQQLQELRELKAPDDDKPGGAPRSTSPAGQKKPEQKKAGQEKADQKDQKEQSKPGPGPDPEKPESPVERTSTFVPLRSDDVRSAPAPRKPETGAPTGTGASDADPAAPAASGTPGPSTRPPAPSWAAAERTRQQPLPPRPPLDLLAELTNTPPPPETPVRTAVRRVKIWTPLVLLLLIVFAIVQMVRPLPEPVLELTAKPTYTFEGGETKLSWPGQGQSAVMVDGVGSLGTEGAQKPAPIASVAKVMTAYVILKEHPLKGDEAGETITADQKAEDESKNADESVAPLTNGQKLSQREMLQLLMIPSGNNAARLLARWDAGSEDKFIDKMNDAAKDLGMADSTYTDPSGLEKTTVSTATDQLKLAQAVMRNEVFRKIVDMPEVEIKGIDGKIYNNNTLLLESGVSGIKTGSSTPAGGNLLWSANTKVDGKILWIYGAVMGQQAGTGRVYDSLSLSLSNSLKLIKDAQEAPTSATVVKKGDVVGYVDNGFGARTPVIATKNLKAVGWSGLEVELKVTDSGKGIAHAAKAGSEVGMVTVGTGTGKVTAPVVLQDDLPEPAFGDKLTRIG